MLTFTCIVLLTIGDSDYVIFSLQLVHSYLDGVLPYIQMCSRGKLHKHNGLKASSAFWSTHFILLLHPLAKQTY